jgi:thiosulfate dehydrogenase [quinone] large subunit
MSDTQVVSKKGEILIPDPPLARFLFGSVKLAWLWLILRLYLAYVWLPSGWGKINNPAWMNGAAIKGFWQNAVAIPTEGRPQITFEWYRGFLQFMIDQEWNVWFGPLVAYSELIIGILLLLGAFTGIAAFLGGFMNLNFMLAGVASTNPLMYSLAILAVMAWKVAGWYGLDRWLLPKLGTPWTRQPVTRGTAIGVPVPVRTD